MKIDIQTYFGNRIDFKNYDKILNSLENLFPNNWNDSNHILHSLEINNVDSFENYRLNTLIVSIPFFTNLRSLKLRFIKQELKK